MKRIVLNVLNVLYWCTEAAVSDVVTSSLSSGAITAVVIAIVILVVVLAIVAICFRRRRQIKVMTIALWWWQLCVLCDHRVCVVMCDIHGEYTVWRWNCYRNLLMQTWQLLPHQLRQQLHWLAAAAVLGISVIMNIVKPCIPWEDKPARCHSWHQSTLKVQN